MTSRPGRSHKPRLEKKGSLTVFAFIVISLLLVVVLAYHFSSVSTHKMFHHTYYSEKSLGIIDGLTVIARGVVQKHLNVIIDSLKPEDGPSDLSEHVPGGLTAAVKQLAEQVKLMGAGTAESRGIDPDIDVKVEMVQKSGFSEGYATVKDDGQEIIGKIRIIIECGFKGFASGLRFRVPRRIVRTDYEFKKLRAEPPFFHHFSLFVKDAFPKPEREDEFAEGNSNFNHLVVDSRGVEASAGGALFLDNGPILSEGSLPEITGERTANPFYSQVPYVYLGSGGGHNAGYLNVTAGGGAAYDPQGARQNHESKYGENFMLYRGERTDFYRVLSAEFSNFLQRSPKVTAGSAEEPTGGGGGLFAALGNMLRSVVRSIGNFFKSSFAMFKKLDALERSNEEMQSANLPIYYVVRKDYGYAKEWGDNPQYEKYGLGKGKVFASSLHLYNALDGEFTVTPTLVLGKVYRRCLSLSGYKQRRGDPGSERQFEVQAGPIEYFPDINSLFKRTQDWSRPEEGDGPIWTWDARVNWVTNRPAAPGQQAGKANEPTGNFIPLSGPSLFGRLVPGFSRLHDDDPNVAEKLFQHSVNPPEVFFGGGTAGQTGENVAVNETNADQNRMISSIFVMFNNKGGFKDLVDKEKLKSAVQDGTVFGEMGTTTSPYYEELMRQFVYSAAGIPAEKMAELTEGEKTTVEAAATTWKTLLELRAEDQSLAPVVKQLDPNSILNPKKKEYWVDQPNNETINGIFPFSLPDPWANSAQPPIGNNFEQIFDSTVGNKDEFYKKYFKPAMTNPGRVLPYNYSMRFWFSKLLDLFTKTPEERLEALKKVIPEVRDGAFGHLDDTINPYLKPDPNAENDPPLDDDVLAKIFEMRQGDESLKAGYFFMDEYAGQVKAPRDIDLNDILPGQRFCWKEMGPDLFAKRFVKGQAENGVGSDVLLGTVVKVSDQFNLGPASVRGGGAIICEGTMVITGDIVQQPGGPPLYLIAKGFEIKEDVRNIDASIVCRGPGFRLGGANDLRVQGRLILEGWEPDAFAQRAGAAKRLRFGGKSDPANPPFLYNLEPRPHRYEFDAEASAEGE